MENHSYINNNDYYNGSYLFPANKSKENSDNNVTKTLLDLDMSGQSSTFAELFNSADHFEDIYNALVEKFGKENLPSDVSQYEAFLKEHNIPTVVSSAEALIDMIKNCR